jgi:hypothetical protein
MHNERRYNMKTFTRTVLIADEDKMLTDGEIYAKSVELGDWDKAENYREITEEEYEKIQAKYEDEIITQE